MKTSVIITALLFTQVSASFFDVFQGAVLSVQNSFGKLLSDVVTDVKDTVDCTILAVEHVLSLSEDATIRYYDKCGQGTNQTTPNDPKKSESLPKMEVSIKFPPSEEYLQKIIPAEIDARINKTLSKVLEDYKPHNNLLSIENVLAKESEQLADVSDLVKKEMKKLSNEVTADLEHIKQRDSGPSVDTILEEIKVLEKSEQNARNVSEAVEIHQVIDEVLDKLDAIEATEANENDKLEEILRDLENNSNNSFLGLRQQFEEWKKEESRHLSEIKDKIEEHEKIYNHTNKVYDSNHTQIVLLSKDKQNDTSEPLILSQGILTVQVSKAKDVTTKRITNADGTEKPNESGFIQNLKSTTVDGTNESVTTNRSLTTNTKSSNKLPIDTSVRTLETLMLLRTDRTTASTQRLDPNDIIITSTSNYPPIIETTTDNKPIRLETSTDSSREDLTAVMAVDNSTDSINTDVVTGNTLENVTSQNTDGVIVSTTEDFAITTEITTTVANNSNNIPATSTLTPETPSPESIDAIVTATPPNLFEEPTTFISNKSMISNVSGNSNYVETTTTLEVFANTSPSESEEPSKLITDSPTSPAKIFVTESNTNPTSSSSITESTVTPEMLQSVIRTTTTPLQTAESTEIQSVENTTRSEEEEPSHKATTLSIDSNTSFITSTSKMAEIMATTNEETTQLPTETVSVVIEHVENTTSSEGPNLNKNGVTTTTIPISERTLSTENLPSVKNTTPTHEEFSTLTLSDSRYTTITSTLPPAVEKATSTALNQSEESTLSDEIEVSTLPKIKNLDHIATSTEFKTIISKTTTENIKTVETTIASETKEPTDLTTNDIVTSSTVFSPPKENPLLSEVISVESSTASYIEKGLLKTDDMLRTTPRIITNPNFTISSPPLMVTDGPPIINKVSLIDHPMIPVNNPWLTPKSVEKANSNKISPQNYNMPRIPKIHNDLPQSLTGGLLDTRWPLYDPHQVNNAPQKFGIPKGFFPAQFQNHKSPDYHGRKNDFIKNRFSDVGATPAPINPVLTKGPIPILPKQQPQVEISAHDQAVFDEFDSMSDSGWPSSSMDEILNLAEMPIAPEKKTTPSPRVPTDRGRINGPERPLQSPYNRPPGLTTNRPPINARTDDSQNMPVDYDSFFHIPQKNTEAHQRALKDAQQLIANSQLSNRIIDRVLRSKNTVGARSIFNNPRTLNSGK
ncbi:putative leucine-rich repeat-containing protein DDB_G0290503 [Helicoverpa zea]|uniref:putative leucine-rich repeat-containing protein DDB_G0290503 n=1 Tax=Helicoverpa zea TaxID=7113 RepID=UPI001F59E57D|nr:putative leucine-rich repeat-containing protein DDB_G0290503 [Helicoverpa zea]